MNESKSSRYHRHRRWAESLALAAQAFALGATILGDAVPSLSQAVPRMLTGSGLPTPLVAIGAGAISALTLSLVLDVSALPFVVYSRYVLERRYRESRLGLAVWFRTYVSEMGIHAAVWISSGIALYAIIWRWPSAWWLVAGVVFLSVTIVTTYLGPRIVLPWLYRLRPIVRPSLRTRLDALTRRAGTPVIEIQEWRLGKGNARLGAALVGLGATRQVLLTDALLSDCSDDEIEVVVAHELAHDRHRDMWQTIAFEGVAVTLAGGAAHLAMNGVAPMLGLSGVPDVAGLPVLALVAGGVVLVMAPVRNCLSRRHERRADRYALDLTKNPEALASSLRRLEAQALAEERPSRLVEWLFYTHPPLADRAARARSARTVDVSSGQAF